MLLLSILFVNATIWGQEKTVPQLLDEIDYAIEHSAEYVAGYEEKIADASRLYLRRLMPCTNFIVPSSTTLPFFF